MQDDRNSKGTVEREKQGESEERKGRAQGKEGNKRKARLFQKVTENTKHDGIATLTDKQEK